MAQAPPAKAEALQAVERAVLELQEADFSGVNGLLQAKAKLTAALQLARELGASEQEVLEAGRAKTIEVEDPSAAGAAARKARKLRLLEKEFLNRDKIEEERRAREREEEARAARVAERLAARRAPGKGGAAEQAKAEKERQEAERQAAERAERVAQAAAARRAARAKEQAAASPSPSSPPPPPGAAGAAGATTAGRQAAAAPSSVPPGVSTAVPARTGPESRFGGVSAQAGSPSCTARSRSRSQSRPRPPPRGALQQEGAPASPPPADGVLAVPSLSALLGRAKSDEDLTSADGSPASGRAAGGAAAAKPPLTMADIPIGVLMGGSSLLAGGALAMGAAGDRRLGIADLSTGGGQTCYNFSVGKCTRWSCRFKHVRPEG